jgi:hypothetical protein
VTSEIPILTVREDVPRRRGYTPTGASRLAAGLSRPESGKRQLTDQPTCVRMAIAGRDHSDVTAVPGPRPAAVAQRLAQCGDPAGPTHLERDLDLDLDSDSRGIHYRTKFRAHCPRTWLWVARRR